MRYRCSRRVTLPGLKPSVNISTPVTDTPASADEAGTGAPVPHLRQGRNRAPEQRGERARCHELCVGVRRHGASIRTTSTVSKRSRELINQSREA